MRMTIFPRKHVTNVRGTRREIKVSDFKTPRAREQDLSCSIPSLILIILR